MSITYEPIPPNILASAEEYQRGPLPHKTPPSPQIGDATDGKATSIPLTGGGCYYHDLQEDDYEEEEEDAGGQRGGFLM